MVRDERKTGSKRDKQRSRERKGGREIWGRIKEKRRDLS